jgi:hypothetical protein
MNKPSLPQISMEAISYQGRSLLLFDLVAVIDGLRTEPQITQKALTDSGLEDVVFSRTGMRVRFELSEDGFVTDIFAEPPLVDAANPYYKLLANLGFADSRLDLLDRHQRSVRLAEDSLGWVDLKLGRVNGVYSKLICRVCIPDELLKDRDYTSEEIAGVLLHELGHLFSYFETMAYSVASNVVISTATDALMGMSEKSEKVRLISQVNSLFGNHDKETVEAIAESREASVVRALLLRTFEEGEQRRTKHLSSEGDNAPYNTRSIEYMADQFAIRHGAALALASAQHKMAKLNHPNYDSSRASFMAMQATRLTLLILTTAVNPVLGIVVGAIASMALTLDAHFADYSGDPSERIARMKADLVQLLKNTRLNAKFRQQILQDIDAIDALRDQIKEHSGIFRYLWRNIIPTGRRQVKIREFQKGLEDLINNDLFIHANRLRAL